MFFLNQFKQHKYTVVVITQSIPLGHIQYAHITEIRVEFFPIFFATFLNLVLYFHVTRLRWILLIHIE